MLSALVTLLDQPMLLRGVLGIGALIGIGVERFFASFEHQKRRAYWRGRSAAKTRPGFRRELKAVPLKGTPERAVLDAADQLACVMAAQFKPRALLNQPERRLLAVIDQALAEFTPGWRAMGQVSMGEILSSPDKDAYFAVNSKRIDLLIVDADCRPLHAVEFQGTGHHLSGNTAARDAVKKEALRRAGIGFIEVVSGDTPAEVRQKIRKLIPPQASVRPQRARRAAQPGRS